MASLNARTKQTATKPLIATDQPVTADELMVQYNAIIEAAKTYQEGNPAYLSGEQEILNAIQRLSNINNTQTDNPVAEMKKKCPAMLAKARIKEEEQENATVKSRNYRHDLDVSVPNSTEFLYAYQLAKHIATEIDARPGKRISDNPTLMETLAQDNTDTFMEQLKPHSLPGWKELKPKYQLETLDQTRFKHLESARAKLAELAPMLEKNQPLLETAMKLPELGDITPPTLKAICETVSEKLPSLRQ